MKQITSHMLKYLSVIIGIWWEMQNIVQALLHPFQVLGLKSTEIMIYALLFGAQRPYRVKEIAKKANISERAVRGYVSTFVKKGVIEKQLVPKSKKIVYHYSAAEPAKIFGTAIAELRKDISGLKEAMELHVK